MSTTNGRCLLCPALPDMTHDELVAHLAGEHELHAPVDTIAAAPAPGPRVHEVVWVQLRGTAS